MQDIGKQRCKMTVTRLRMTGLLVLLTFVLNFLAPASLLAQTDDGSAETTGSTETDVEARSSLEILPFLSIFMHFFAECGLDSVKVL